MPIARCFDGHDIDKLPVQVVIQNEDNTWKNFEFSCLEEARKIFPTLDPATNTNDFTWACHGRINGKLALRFENWRANNTLSI